MSEDLAELGRRLVVGHKRDGRSIYDEQAKRELIEACLQPEVSLAKVARECGVNANQLATWVRERRRFLARPSSGVDVVEASAAFVAVPVESAMPVAPAAASTPSLQARLPNGVVLDLQCDDLGQLGKLIETLGRVRCSASTKA